MMHLVVDNTQREGLGRRCVTAIAKLLGIDTAKRSSDRQMRLIETLPLGAKTQLHLVSCDGERFLVGTGAESVQSMLQVRGESVPAREVV